MITFPGLVYRLLRLFRLESPNWDALSGIIVNKPYCIKDIIEDTGIASLHVYVSDYIVIC